MLCIAFLEILSIRFLCFGVLWCLRWIVSAIGGFCECVDSLFKKNDGLAVWFLLRLRITETLKSIMNYRGYLWRQAVVFQNFLTAKFLITNSVLPVGVPLPAGSHQVILQNLLITNLQLYLMTFSNTLSGNFLFCFILTI